ncbi:odh [Symbiodinium natans]|uniref:Odh protein n=1 Tax=Symbiodinium natans TaxID=878477 RepID=A0A812LS24_9DINO|nr:odh [Symbiodinium natans]
MAGLDSLDALALESLFPHALRGETSHRCHRDSEGGDENLLSSEGLFTVLEHVPFVSSGLQAMHEYLGNETALERARQADPIGPNGFITHAAEHVPIVNSVVQAVHKAGDDGEALQRARSRDPIGSHGYLTKVFEHIPLVSDGMVAIHKYHGEDLAAERARGYSLAKLLSKDGAITRVAELVPGSNLVAVLGHYMNGDKERAARAMNLVDSPLVGWSSIDDPNSGLWQVAELIPGTDAVAFAVHLQSGHYAQALRSITKTSWVNVMTSEMTFFIHCPAACETWCEKVDILQVDVLPRQLSLVVGLSDVVTNFLREDREVLLCGIPGCGKDAIGRACAREFPEAAALSQDEHGGSATSTRAAFEVLLSRNASPIFVLRNGVDVGDRLPFLLPARTAGYRVMAALPGELAQGADRKAALFLASVSGCYGRLKEGGRSGHETLTVTEKLAKPAQVCLDFLRSFRAPSAPGEVDAVLQLQFLLPDLSDFSRSLSISLDEVAVDMRKGKALPDAVAQVLEGPFEAAQAQLAPFAAARRPLQELIRELADWCKSERGKPCTPTEATAPRKPADTKQLQRAAKIRAAVEHLVAPYNLESCRPNGSTVTTCVWVPTATGLRPAWPPSYFCGAPQLRKMNTTQEDVLAAARESSASEGPLQDGDKGVRIEVIESSEHPGPFVGPVDPLPEPCRVKLKCPNL